MWVYPPLVVIRFGEKNMEVKIDTEFFVELGQAVGNSACLECQLKITTEVFRLIEKYGR